MKKKSAALLAAFLLLSLSACGSTAEVSREDYETLLSENEALQQELEDLKTVPEASEASEVSAEEAEAYNSNANRINLSTEYGALHYTGFQTADDELLSGNDEVGNVCLFCFDFTNYQSVPTPVWSAFAIQFFQNGTELDELGGYEGGIGEQFNLLSAYSDNVMQDATLSFARAAILQDDSPVTIMVTFGTEENDYLMMEVSPTGESSGSVEAVDPSLLTGTWEVTEVVTDSGETYTVSELEKMKNYSWSDWCVIISEAGDMYIQTNHSSATNTAQYSDSYIRAGNNVWTVSGDRLTWYSISRNSQVYYEKVSDSQEFPSPQKQKLIDLLSGTWEDQSSTRTAAFVFDSSGKTASAVINDVDIGELNVDILTKENRIVLSSSSGDYNVSMDIDYVYDRGALTLNYSGDMLTRQ